MKRILYTLIISLTVCTAKGQEQTPSEATDTVINISDPKNIILSETPEGIKLILEGTDSVMTFSYSHPDPENVDISTTKRPSIGTDNSIVVKWNMPNKIKFDVFTSGLSFGKNFAFDQPSPMDITTGKSWEISWLYILGVRFSRGGNSFRAGIGMNWRNYKLTGPYQFAKADGEVKLTPYPENSHGEWSRLKVTTLSVPLLYTRRIWKSLNFTVGGIINFTTHSSIKTRFMYEDREITTTENGIYPRPVTVDAYGAVTVCGIGWYVRYSPMNVIRTDRGPQFSALSTGMVITL
ncbi:MAG: hypothetical protein NC127_01115 [Muribaculum sp.]|nr:hypothetical protein [Muribaculum sp.]